MPWKQVTSLGDLHLQTLLTIEPMRAVGEFLDQHL